MTVELKFTAHRIKETPASCMKKVVKSTLYGCSKFSLCETQDGMVENGMHTCQQPARYMDSLDGGHPAF